MSSDYEKPNELTKIRIEQAANGGYTVYSQPDRPGFASVIMGAYSCAADLIQDMPDILGGLSLKVSVLSEVQLDAVQNVAWPQDATTSNFDPKFDLGGPI